MQRIAIYGKGGGGKTMLATGVSRLLARRGLRVLHVGCDPKRDSTLRLTGHRARLTSMDVVSGRMDDAIVTTPDGIDCIETGGPPAGTGCAGRGILITMELLERQDVLARRGYDAVVFDVLGDLVCGGFAGPLRADARTKVIVVLSDEPMSLYAANNITRMVRTYASSGATLAGLVLNRPSGTGDADAVIARFAASLGTRVLASLPREPAVVRAERARHTILDAQVPPAFIASIEHVLDEVLALDPASVALPTPLDDDALESALWEPPAE